MNADPCIDALIVALALIYVTFAAAFALRKINERLDKLEQRKP